MQFGEPSVVAAASHMAKLTHDFGGFESSYSGSAMIAQIHVINLPCPFSEKHDLFKRKEELMTLAYSCDNTLVSLSGGVQDIEIRVFDHGDKGPVLAIHLVVNVLDAIGANAVNSMAKKIAPLVEEITKGEVLHRILSNLAEYRLVREKTQVPFKQVETKEFTRK